MQVVTVDEKNQQDVLENSTWITNFDLFEPTLLILYFHQWLPKCKPMVTQCTLLSA